jgi:hypothetical protein
MFAMREQAMTIYETHAAVADKLQQDWAVTLDCNVHIVPSMLRSRGKDRLDNAIRGAYSGLVGELPQLTLIGPQESSLEWGAAKLRRLGKNEIWIEGDDAPFADAVAHRALYRFKDRGATGKVVEIDLVKELSRCGLLKGQDEGSLGRNVLQGLLEIWDQSDENDDNKEPLDDLPSNDGSGSGKTVEQNDTESGSRPSPSALLRFVFVTNAERIKVTIDNETVIVLYASGGKFVPSWQETGFMKKVGLLDGVVVEFLSSSSIDDE